MTPAAQNRFSQEELEARKRVENSPLSFFISRIGPGGNILTQNSIFRGDNFYRTHSERDKKEAE